MSRYNGVPLIFTVLTAVAPVIAQPCTPSEVFGTVATYPAGTNAIRVCPGDLNGDGRNDLAVAGGRDIRVLFNTGDGTFGPPTTVELGGGSSNDLALGDLDGDSDLDNVVAK